MTTASPYERCQPPLDANPPRCGLTVALEHRDGTRRMGIVAEIHGWSPATGYELMVVVPVVGRDHGSTELPDSLDVTWRAVAAQHVTDPPGWSRWRWRFLQRSDAF